VGEARPGIARPWVRAGIAHRPASRCAPCKGGSSDVNALWNSSIVTPNGLQSRLYRFDFAPASKGSITLQTERQMSAVEVFYCTYGRPARTNLRHALERGRLTCLPQYCRTAHPARPLDARSSGRMTKLTERMAMVPVRAGTAADRGRCHGLVAGWRAPRQRRGLMACAQPSPPVSA